MMRGGRALALAALCVSACLPGSGGGTRTGTDVQAVRASVDPERDDIFIRVNQLGYRPDAPKFAVICALSDVTVASFVVRDADGRTVLTGSATDTGPFAACVRTWRLDFSSIRTPGTYRVWTGSIASRP